MGLKAIDQIIPGAGRYDAITTQARWFGRWLRERGVASTIFAPHIEEGADFEGEIRPLSAWPTDPAAGVIYHHSLGLPEVEPLLHQRPAALVYHNITPARYFTTADPARARRMTAGREQLARLAPHMTLAIGDSHFNLAELAELGITRQAVVPIAVESPMSPPPPNFEQGPHLLFVGRIAPNKRQEDLLRVVAHLRQIDPRTHLTLVGAAESASYNRWLDDLIAKHQLQEHVTRTGPVTDEALADIWCASTVYLSLSEHEGFGKPLIEAMGVNRPVVSLARAAVPETMGQAGIVIEQLHVPAVAELLYFLHQPENQPFVERLLAHQRERAAEFAPPAVQSIFYEVIQSIQWL